MRLAEYTDYTLRVLMYCATHPGRRITIAELAEHHRVSKNHLMKIVNALAREGLLETTRGRGGGLRARSASATSCAAARPTSAWSSVSTPATSIVCWAAAVG